MAKEVIAEVCGVRLWRFSPPGLTHAYLAVEDESSSPFARTLRFIDEHQAFAAFDRRVLSKTELPSTDI